MPSSAAGFWAFLWGPIGLLLATPLTVCLVVLGRHVPRLEFLEVMLGDKDIFEYYQPETGAGPPKAASTFGWSSALFIELAIEESRENSR